MERETRGFLTLVVSLFAAAALSVVLVEMYDRVSQHPVPLLLPMKAP